MRKNRLIYMVLVLIICVAMLTACGSSGHTCGVCGKNATHQVGSGWYCSVHYKDAQMLYNKWK